MLSNINIAELDIFLKIDNLQDHFSKQRKMTVNLKYIGAKNSI